MAERTKANAPGWFWLVAIVFLLWSLAGCFACYTQLTLTPQDLAKLPAAQQDAWSAMTPLPKIAYVVAVAAGLLGSILLLMRSGLARLLFIVSLIGVLIQFGWFFGIYAELQKLGASSAAFPAFIVAMALIEIWFSGLAARRGWLR
ncbi:hypothetical protein [Sphingobium boeckii]|uniref:Sugar transporter n=1 Tax=Sphingobium boeckii TaxID=1082345 RepID=A0A7W9AGA6_9SPHN|nr:hypothetical protein [Sphingobium boeckii]MBB5685048.1 hypothetical protein [Sphingobium boeckii]